MNCHGDNKEKQGTHNHSPLKHIWHMILCCDNTNVNQDNNKTLELEKSIE